MFQNTLGESKLTRILLCTNRMCEVNRLSSKHRKRTMLGIYCLTHSDNSSKKENSQVEKLLFYVCKECLLFDFSPFGKPVYESVTHLHINRMPSKFTSKFNEIENSRGIQKCLFCGLKERVGCDYRRIDESTEEPDYKIKPCVFKLFVKEGKRRNYVGFLCLQCNSVYFKHNFQFFTKNSFKQSRRPFDIWVEIAKKKRKAITEYKTVSLEETNDSNRIDKQRLKTWNALKLNQPPSNETIEFDALGMHYTGGMREEIPQRHTLTLENLTLSKYKEAVKRFGTEQQKNELIRLGYLSDKN